MTSHEFAESLKSDQPPANLSVPLTALWWDAKENWTRAHDLVNDLETRDGMAVHAYLHRKSGETSNSEYWYRQLSQPFSHQPFEEEWQALVEELLAAA